MRRLLKEPLLHFLVLGAALFGLFNVVAEKEAEQPARIVVSGARVESLAKAFASTWRRLPSPDELRGLVEEHIREQVYYREAKALGLDQDDVVVRRRLRQKLEFITEDMAAVEPTDEQLAAFLLSNIERFKSDDRLTFTHVFISDARRDGLQRAAAVIADELSGAQPKKDVAALGDNFLLGHEFRDVARGNVARTFGAAFADKIATLERGRWEGPIASSYGLHFVRVSDRIEGGPLPLDSARAAVRREWLNERRLQAEADFYRKLRQRYQIVVEPFAAGPAGVNVSEVSQ